MNCPNCGKPRKTTLDTFPKTYICEKGHEWKNKRDIKTLESNRKKLAEKGYKHPWEW